MCYRCTILDTHNVLLWLLGGRYFLRSYVCLTMSKNCPHFRTFINTFTRGRHLSLSWSRSILSTPSLFSLLSILILSPHLGRRIEACHFRSCFLKKSLFTFFLTSVIRSSHLAFLSLLGLITLIMFGDWSDQWSSWICSSLQFFVSFSLLAHNCPSGPIL